jgi:hypothetical protein
MQLIHDHQWSISELPDAQLLHMLAEGSGEHGQAAVKQAAAELMRRGVNVPPSLYRPESSSPLETTFATTFAISEEEREKQRKPRRDLLVQLAGVYAFLALIAWGFYTDDSDPTRLAEKVYFWFHAALFVGGLCVLLGRKLLDKE